MKQLICCALLLTAFSACRPELRVNQDFDIPQDKALQSSLDVENALQSSYAYLRSPHCYGGSWMLWPEIMSDNVVHNPNTPYSTPELQIYNRNLLPSDTMIGRSWQTAYKAIGISNSIIDVITKGRIVDSDFEANKNRFLGEAHFIRAITLFELVRFFAPQYSQVSKGQPAIPLPLENFTSVTYLPRSSVEQVYQQVLQDLRISADYFKAGNIGVVPFLPSDLFPLGAGFEIFNRANYHIANAFRARVLMQMGEPQHLEEAISLISTVIEDKTDTIFRTTDFDIRDVADPLKYYPNPYPLFGSDLATINFMFSNNSARGVSLSIASRKQYEFLFSIMNFRNDDPSTNTVRYFTTRFAYGKRQGFLNLPCPYFVIRSPQTNIFRRSTDKRFRSFFINNSDYRISINGVERPSCLKYNGEIVNIPIIRSADLLLLRAEANALLGRKRKALFDLLFVKYRANMAPEDSVSKYYSEIDADQGFIVNEILRERRREMLLEGDRLHALRRLRRDIPDAPNGENRPGIAWDSEKLIFPIPFVETNVNPNLN